MNRTLKSNTVPMKFDAYLVSAGEALMGFDLTMTGAEKMARAWNRDAKMGLKAHELTAYKVAVVVTRDGDKFTACVVDSDGDEISFGDWSSRQMGNALLIRKMQSVARPVPFAGGWVVEARLAGGELPDVPMHLETTGLKFYPAADAARMERANPTLNFGMTGKGRTGLLRGYLREARQAWARNPSY